MENALGAVRAAAGGIFPSFLTQLDKPFAFVATVDVGRESAKQLLRPSPPSSSSAPLAPEVSVVELEGPRRHTQTEVSEILAKLWGRPLKIVRPDRSTWESTLASAGLPRPNLVAGVYDGLNQGWICFEGSETVKGSTTLEQVLAPMVDAAKSAPAPSKQAT